MSNFYKFTAAGNAEAQSLFARARVLDPNFAEAHAWWAYAVVLGMIYWEDDPDPAVLDKALAAAHEAVALDSQNALFHMLMGRVQLARREYASAMADCERAVTLNGTLALGFCGLGDSLAYEGRYADAIAQFNKAVEMSPNHPQLWAFLSYGALALLFDRQFEKALAWAERACALPNCQYWAVSHAVVALAHLERLEEAQQFARRLKQAQPTFTLGFARKKLFYLKRNDQIALYMTGLKKAGIGDG